MPESVLEAREGKILISKFLSHVWGWSQVMIVCPKGSVQLIVVAIYGAIEILGLRVDKRKKYS